MALTAKAPKLERVTFEVSRAAEYLRASDLVSMTSQNRPRFAAVALKELVDNALDAAEAAGIAPQVEVSVTTGDGLLSIEVADNGTGLPADTVRRILNFDTRTSDKAAYLTPTRGAQGNAFKTLLGMPWALGLDEALDITSLGVRHQVRSWLDPAGQVRVDHDQTPTETPAGTSVRITLPAEGQELDPVSWVRAFAVFNPHLSVNFRPLHQGSMHAYATVDGEPVSYRASAGQGWHKFCANETPSAWWYDEKAFTALVHTYLAKVRSGGQSTSLRDFIRIFRGLSSTGKVKAICASVSGVRTLEDLDANVTRCHALLAALKQHSKPLPPAALGVIGQEHFEAMFKQFYGVKRIWYGKVTGEHEGLPFVFEAAVAETPEPGDVFVGVNFSPSLSSDPLAAVPLETPESRVHGLLGLLDLCHANPIASHRRDAANVAAAFHLVSPAFVFLDKGKARIDLPKPVADAIGGAAWKALKTLYQEGERARKDADRAEKAAERRERETAQEDASLVDLVFSVLPGAIAAAAGALALTSARTLFYQVRPMLQQHTARDLNYDYFSQQLLTRYRQTVKEIPELYYDARGVLYEPHTGREIQLGTREVGDYEFPDWLFDKVLYVEKKGLWPVLKAAGLAERYDMAMIRGEGFACEAVRTLFARAAHGGRCQLFVLHDADPDGYNIARTLGAATKRMPEHQVDVIDIGLKLEDALAAGLETETFTRRKKLPAGLELNKVERLYFEGKPSYGGKGWIAQRVELNALSGPALIAYIERKLEENGVRGKVVPPADVLTLAAEERRRQAIASQVRQAIEAEVDMATIVDRLCSQFEGRVPLDAVAEWVSSAFEVEPATSWREALHASTHEAAFGLAAEIRTAVQEALRDGKP